MCKFHATLHDGVGFGVAPYYVDAHTAFVKLNDVTQFLYSHLAATYFNVSVAPPCKLLRTTCPYVTDRCLLQDSARRQHTAKQGARVASTSCQGRTRIDHAAVSADAPPRPLVVRRFGQLRALSGSAGQL